MSNKTTQQYNNIVKQCKDIFIAKNSDYGTSWRIMRVGSIADQIFIKATRIRNIEELGSTKINEGIEPEFIGIINYCIMALIQIELKDNEFIDINISELSNFYDKHANAAYLLMTDKNHDYGEVWRIMQVSTFTDMILMRINRIHQILANKGKTIVSEGVESNFMDMLNYAIFALIRMDENKNTTI